MATPRTRWTPLLGVAVALVLAGTAHAAPLTVSTYDMPNGGGQASGGTFNYWDAGYTGSGLLTTDGAALSGGLGKLTDGVIATEPWYSVSNNSGTGEYVGWRNGYQTNPSVVFHFAGVSTINSVTVYLDNSFVGGVAAPTDIIIDGQDFVVPALGGPATSVTFNLTVPPTVSTMTLQFLQQSTSTYPWVFISEVEFDGTLAPEPASLALLGAGLAGLGVLRRRTRT